MSYQTGNASSPNDLLQQFATWITALGWTADRNASDSAGWRLHLHKGSVYVHLRACVADQAFQDRYTATPTGLAIYCSTSYDGAQPWNNQPGAPPLSVSSGKPFGSAMTLPSASIRNYYFFADASADNVVAVVETTLGLYGYVGWGQLSKAGTITGGSLFFGSVDGYYFGRNSANTPGYDLTSLSPCSEGGVFGEASAFVRADVDAFTNKWLGVAKSGSLSTGKYADSCLPGSGVVADGPSYGSSAAALFLNATNSLDARTTLLPLMLYAKRDAGGSSLLGFVPFVYASNAVGKGFSAASVYAIASENYMLFPNFAVKKQ
jgi:hypothetical protein